MIQQPYLYIALIVSISLGVDSSIQSMIQSSQEHISYVVDFLKVKVTPPTRPGEIDSILFSIDLSSKPLTNISTNKSKIHRKEDYKMMKHANKLGSILKMELMASNDSLTMEKKLNLFLQVSSPLSDTMRDQLKKLHAEIRTEAGDVLTVTFPADQLKNLLPLDFVVYVELSTPLTTE